MDMMDHNDHSFILSLFWAAAATKENFEKW